MRKKIDYYLIRFFLGLGKILPEKLITLLSIGLLKLYYILKPKRVAIMRGNIQKAFPDFSVDEVEQFAREVYSQVSKTMTELVLIHADRLDIDSAITNRTEAIEKLRTVTDTASHGVIYIMAHYGNWELLGHFMAKNGFPLVGVVKEGKNRLVEQQILIPFRGKYGNESIGHASSMISITKALKAKKSVSLAIDQVVQPPNGVLVDFFGHQTAATKAIAMLKLKYNPLVVPIFITRVGSKQFNIAVHDPVEVTFDSGLPEEEKIVVMTQAYYDIIEKQIRQAPTQWLWLYNRWKEIRYVK